MKSSSGDSPVQRLVYECLDGVEAFLFAEVQVDLLFGDLLNHVADLLPRSLSATIEAHVRHIVQRTRLRTPFLNS